MVYQKVGKFQLPSCSCLEIAAKQKQNFFNTWKVVTFTIQLCHLQHDQVGNYCSQILWSQECFPKKFGKFIFLRWSELVMKTGLLVKELSKIWREVSQYKRTAEIINFYLFFLYWKSVVWCALSLPLCFLPSYLSTDGNHHDLLSHSSQWLQINIYAN